MNTHLQPSGKEEDVQPEVGLYFTDQAPRSFPILVELQNDEALNIPAGQRGFVVKDELILPEDVDLLAIYPHAHYLGKHLMAYAQLPDGTRKTLIDVPDWNLSWQAVFRYAQPVFLPKGTAVAMRFEYDNSAANIRNPHSPPQRVEAGNRAEDEMGHLWLQLLPRGRGDRRRVIQEAVAEHRLAQNPNDFAAYLSLGAILLSRLDAQGAESALRQAIRVDGTRPEAHDMLGVALQRLGRAQESMGEFAVAVKTDPEYLDARFHLARALAARGDYVSAVVQMKVVAAAFPQVEGVQEQLRELQTKAASK